jgi:hypothetical protein
VTAANRWRGRCFSPCLTVVDRYHDRDGLLALRSDDHRCVVIAFPESALLAQVATLHRHGALRLGLCRCSTDMSPKHGFQAAPICGYVVACVLLWIRVIRSKRMRHAAPTPPAPPLCAVSAMCAGAIR